MLNFDPTAGEAPPQAPAPTSTLNDFADLPTEVPSATDVLRTANFGDKGAQQYADLAAAGQQRPNPGLAGITGSAAAPAAAPSSSVGPGDLMALLGDVAMGAAGDPQAGIKREAAQLSLQRQQQAMQVQAQAAAQGQAKSDIEFLDKLKGVLPQYRGPLMSRYFTSQGRDVPPEMAAMIGDQSVLKDLTSPATIARVQSDPQFAALFMTSLDKPKEFLTLLNDLRKADADADKAVDDAAKAHAQAIAEPSKLRGDAAKAALDIATKIRSANKTPSAADIEVLDAAGMSAWQVAIPGVAGGKMWTTGPKRLAPAGAVDINAMHQGEQEKAAGLAVAKEHAVTTSSTRTMKEAAPKVTQLADKALESLAKTETGPLKGRWNELMTGKIGAKNPDFFRLRTELGLLSTMMMRMHVGARGSEGMLQHFNEMFANAAQSPENMRVALSVAKEYADMVHATKEGEEITAPNFKRIEGGGAAGAAPAPGTPPPGAKIIKFGDL